MSGVRAHVPGDTLTSMRLVMVATLASCIGCATAPPRVTRTEQGTPPIDPALAARPVPDLDTSQYPYVYRLPSEAERAHIEREIEAGSPGWNVTVGELGYVTGGYAPLAGLGDDRDAAISTFLDRWRAYLGVAPEAVATWSDYYRRWHVGVYPPWPYVRLSFDATDGENLLLRGHGWYGLPYPSQPSSSEVPDVLQRYLGRPITIHSSVHSHPCDPHSGCRTGERCCGRAPAPPPPRDDVLRAEHLRPFAALVISFDRERQLAFVREIWRVTFVTRYNGNAEERVVPNEPLPRYVDARTGEPLEIQDQFGQAEAIVAFDGERFIHSSAY